MNGIFYRGVVCVGVMLGIIGIGCKDSTKPATQNSSASLHIGKTESRNNLSSSTMTSSSDNAGFNSSYLVFVNESGHPLISRVLPLLTNSLNAMSQIKRIDVISAGPTKDNRQTVGLEGSRAPDLFARLNLRSIEEEGALSKKLKAVVTCTLGTQPWQSPHHTGDYATPPLISLTWEATLDHESTFTGLHSDRYGVVAAAIAAEFSKGLTNMIQDLGNKYPALPPLPYHLYGPYSPIADFGFLKAVKAERVSSYYGLFIHNHTFWKFQVASNPVPRLEKIIEAMRADGWKMEYSTLTNTSDYYLAGESNGATLEIFRPRESRSEPADEAKETKVEFVAHYRKPFTPTEVEAAMEKLLSGNTSMEILVPFENSFIGPQRKRFYSELEKAGATTPQAHLTLADYYLRRKETNTAITMLTRAKALTVLLPDASGVESKLESVSKEISPKRPLKLEPTTSTYRDLGVVELTNSFAPATFHKDFGSPMIVFHAGTNGPQVLAVSVQSPHQHQYKWTAIQQSKGMRSMVSSAFGDAAGLQQTFSLDDLKVKLTAKPDKEKKTLKYVIEPAK